MEYVNIPRLDPPVQMMDNLERKLNNFARDQLLEAGLGITSSQISSNIDLRQQTRSNSAHQGIIHKAKRFVFARLVEDLLRRYPFMKYWVETMQVEHTTGEGSIAFRVRGHIGIENRENLRLKMHRYTRYLNFKAKKYGLPFKLSPDVSTDNSAQRTAVGQAEIRMSCYLSVAFGAWYCPEHHNWLDSHNVNSLDIPYELWCEQNKVQVDYKNRFDFASVTSIGENEFVNMYPTHWRMETLLMHIPEMKRFMQTMGRINGHYVPAAYDIGVDAGS